MNELDPFQQDPKEVIAKQHLQKKGKTLRIPPGCKLYSVDRRTGECSEVKSDMSLVNHNEKRLHGMIVPTVVHHKVTESNVFYVVAVNRANALRKWNRVKHRFQLPAEG